MHKHAITLTKKISLSINQSWISEVTKKLQRIIIEILVNTLFDSVLDAHLTCTVLTTVA